MGEPGKFWDRIARRYARTPVPDEAVYQEKLRLTRGCFRPDMEVLEFGCGTGSTAIAHAPHVKHIRAIDISSGMLAIARDKAAAANVANVTFEQAAIDDVTVPDATVDAVLGLSILHLVADRDAVIARVHRMLRPGGVFVSSTACLGDMAWVYRVIAPLGRFLRLLPPVAVFTIAELAASLTGAGFAIDRQWLPAKGKAVFIVARKAA